MVQSITNLAINDDVISNNRQLDRQLSSLEQKKKTEVTLIEKERTRIVDNDIEWA